MPVKSVQEMLLPLPAFASRRGDNLGGEESVSKRREESREREKVALTGRGLQAGYITREAYWGFESDM
jgi:hypothetical protein